MQQGRPRPPTTAMLTGQNAVSRPCIWKIPTRMRACDAVSRPCTRISATDSVAWMFPFHPHREVAAGAAPDTHDARGAGTSLHERHVYRMLACMYRLQQAEDNAMLQLKSYIGESDLQSSQAVWIITSRYGDRVSGNRTHRKTHDADVCAARTARMQQCESVRQGASNMPVIRVSAQQEACYAGKGARAVFKDSFGNDIELPLIEFVGQVVNLTPPGSQKLEVSCALVREMV
jgi:hypothetical protein